MAAGSLILRADADHDEGEGSERDLSVAAVLLDTVADAERAAGVAATGALTVGVLFRLRAGQSGIGPGTFPAGAACRVAGSSPSPSPAAGPKAAPALRAPATSVIMTRSRNGPVNSCSATQAVLSSAQIS
jgi:hypothetical protein